MKSWAEIATFWFAAATTEAAAEVFAVLLEPSGPAFARLASRLIGVVVAVAVLLEVRRQP